MSRILRARLVVGVALVLALSLVVAACGGGGGGGGSQGGGGSEPVSGEIAIEGSSTVQPITQAAAELFREQNPKARISVGGAGTSDGFEAFCQGDTQISDASRPIDVAEEVPVCEENGVEFIEIPVAFDGISVVVNEQNDFASDVTSEQLKTLWEPAAEGEITRWSQVNPQWPDEEISLYGPGTESGTYEFFNETIVGNEEEVNRTDYEASEDDNVLVQGVAGDQNALGYFGFSYYENNLGKLKALSLDGVKPSAETIRSGEYGLSRPIFIYVSTKALKNNDAVKPFVDFYLSEQNLDRLVEAAKYVTLPGSLADESRAQYQDRTTGTVFTEAGEPKGGDLEAALKQAQ
ncbi:MAG: Phosphate ABC transporter, periplasmic phosphate-binding protein PstS [uncultured Rubrobacteraceae bacterium]|uniref:Phosphate-binding protein n=1 Tax=uncultured Rubrobacteraceae bacterium TaxID=349277 RepID=A0A6J4RXH1_9ACTN|nr:MAG: Phosphate ABC transporter, periplasmic phosphate-binding protein PstS [uncultured Rubrobacteraceae bacterium]